jgi:uncharacterized NAD(P)/FAD-binding protein YdhS
MPEKARNIEKFAFIGAQSVGKTTMTNLFRDRFEGNPHVVVLEEEAKKFFESNPNTVDRSVRIQEIIQDQVLTQEGQAHKNPETKLIISDRSVIDPIVLTSIYDTPEHTRRLFERVTGWLPTYTSFILLNPSDVPSEPDENRRETEDERFAIHDAFGEFCRRNDLPIIEVSGTISERADKIESIIFEHFPDRRFFEGYSAQTESGHDRKDKRVAIIGGGFAGLSVTSHLMQETIEKEDQVEITLFEPKDVDGGIPYNTQLPSSFRLNHEADSMGVVNPFLRDTEYDDFHKWIQENKDKELDILGGASLTTKYQDFDLSDPHAFLPRSLYGYYLKDRFAAMVAQGETEGYRFSHRKDLVTDVRKDEDGFTVFDSNTSSRFSSVVLCTGDYFNRESSNIFPATNPQEYLTNQDVKRTDAIGILGSSLSAIETAITLAERGYEKITMFSRAGRLPKIRGNTSEYEPTYISSASIDSLRDSSGMIDPYALASLFKKEFDYAYEQDDKGLYQPKGINWQEIIRNEYPLQQLDEDIKAAQSGEGLLWRSVLASTREWQPDLWNSLSTQDCQMVLEKYTSLILSYFAPMPLIQAEKLQYHLKTGVVNLHPNVVGYESNNKQWTMRLKDNETSVDHLIDARGYSQDASQNSLISSLIEGGLVEKHPINGIRANKQSQITKAGEVVDNLYAIGALLYGERPLNAATPSITHYAREIATQVADTI